jgi:hypothetical protein
MLWHRERQRVLSYQSKKIKQAHNTPMEAQGEEDVYLLLILDLGTRCG